MELKVLRKELKELFNQQCIEAADVDFIISEVLNITRTELLFVNNISEIQEKTIRKFCTLRLDKVPVNKIFQKAYFYGMEFYIDDNVLAPRQDSEILVDTAIKYIKGNDHRKCLDLCTGSGCLAIAIKKHTGIEMHACDISDKALDIARINAKKLTVDIRYIQSDMFENLNGTYDIIISNPPYICSEIIAMLDDEVRLHEPRLALDGGDGGLDFYKTIHTKAKHYLKDGGLLILETGYDQKQMLASIFYDWELLEAIQDYAGLDRVMVFKNRRNI